MKTLVTICLLAVSALAEDGVVLRGTPTMRVLATEEGEVRQKLDETAASKAECVIEQRGKKYFWKSRDNAELLRIDDKQYTYFMLKKGGGFVKVYSGTRADESKTAYIETVSFNGFQVITYWGKVSRP